MGSDAVIVLDTHVFIWYLLNDPRLAESTRDLLAGDPESVFVPTVCFWEAMMLAQSSRISFAVEQPDRELKRQLGLVGFKEAPLSVDIAILSRTLEFNHSDPADRFIAATAYAMNAKLATSDRRLRSLKWVDLAY